MENSKRYFNQKFIGMILIIIGTLFLVYHQIIPGEEFKYIALLTYGVFAGMDSISFSYGGIVVNAEKIEEHQQERKRISQVTE